jgi:CelD/BcsL family acetyltransferase involved in cellulose biosynthesis
MADTAALDTYRFEQAADEAAAASFMHGAVRISISHHLEAVEHVWRSFQTEADGTVFQSFEWLSAWQRHIGAREGVRPLIVLGRNADGRPLFLLPLSAQPAGFGQELVWLGMELCDYTGPLLAPDFSAQMSREAFAELWHALLPRLAARVPFDLVRLEKMPETVGAQPNPVLCLTTSRNPSGAYLTDLAPNWDDFYAAKRSSATRRRERTKRKNLANLGELNFVEPESAADRAATIDTLMQQKAISLARIGVSNLFAQPGYADFYRAVSGEPIVHISRLDVGDIPAAINLGLMMRGRYYHVLASYTDDATVGRYGPGAAHLMEIMAKAIERGCTVFDFTIGDEPYKRDWCDERQTLHDHLSARTAKGALAVAARSVALHVKRTIKENPALWNAFFKLRSLVGPRQSRSSDKS